MVEARQYTMEVDPFGQYELEHIHEALQQLDEQRCAFVLLWLVQGFSNKDTADMLGIHFSDFHEHYTSYVPKEIGGNMNHNMQKMLLRHLLRELSTKH